MTQESNQAGGEHTPGVMLVAESGQTIYILQQVGRSSQNRMSAVFQGGRTEDGLTRPGEVKANARRAAAAWNACENVSTELLEGMGSGAMERSRDRYFAEHSAASRLQQAARRLLDSFGGPIPDRLRDAAQALDNAIEDSVNVSEGRASTG